METSRESETSTQRKNPDVKSVWKEFVSKGHVEPGQVREQIRKAWSRSRALGCDAFLMKAQALSPAETQALLQSERDFIEAAHPYLVALSRAAGAERHAAMLGDRNAVVLEIIGDEDTVRDPNFPAPGSLLSEAVAGANGIGTALAECGYVELIGPEHYIEGFHVYTCQGLPIRGPDDEVLGVLSTSVRRIEAAERIHEILVCAAHGVESELRRIRLERSVRGLFTGRAKDLALSLSKLKEDITQFQAASWLQLQTAAELVSENEKREALSLIEIANKMSADFKKQADLWQSLAEDAFRAPEPVQLGQKVREIADLLKTEASIHEVDLLVSSESSWPMVTIDWGELSRSLFKRLLRAFEAAGRGGAVELSMRARDQAIDIGVTDSNVRNGQANGASATIVDSIQLPQNRAERSPAKFEVISRNEPT